MAATRRLAAGAGAGPWRAPVRVFLGDVELLVVAEVDLPHAGREFPARLRDAAARLWRLRALCAGTVRLDEFYVAPRPAVADLSPADEPAKSAQFAVKKRKFVLSLAIFQKIRH